MVPRRTRLCVRDSANRQTKERTAPGIPVGLGKDLPRMADTVMFLRGQARGSEQRAPARWPIERGNPPRTGH
jgi:hypothetical protein